MSIIKKLFFFIFLFGFSVNAFALISAVEEEDGSPSAFPWKIKFANGNLTDNGDGTVSVADQTGAGGGDPVLIGGNAVNDASGVDLIAGTALDVTFGGAASPDTGTFDFDSTEIEATTWGAGGNASNIWTFNLSGTDHTVTAGSGIMTFSHDIGVLGDNIEATTETNRFVFMANGSTYAPEAIDLGTDTSGNYALGDSEGGAATTGDSATAFFSSGTIEGARLGTFSKSFTITGVTSSGDFGAIWKTPSAITITRINVVQVGATNVVGQLDECDANGANCVTVDTSDITADGNNDADDGSLSNPSIDANDWIGWHTTSVSGTNTRITVTFDYTVN